MATVAVSEVATQAATLRAELKEWERGFAAANGGRKAGRGDIKKVPEIAAKYKEYSRLKSQESAPSNKNDKSHSKPSDPPEQSKKRKHSSPNGPEHSQSQNQSQTTSTLRKFEAGIFQTPSKPRTTHPADVDPYDSPSVLRRLFSPSTHMQTSSPLKTAIGPTPQRDGKALGLFDLLSESGGSTATPSATRIASLKGMAAQTPSKKRKTMDTIMEEDEGEEDTPRLERTPASSGKKYMLSALFATPTAWKYSSIVDDGTLQGVVSINNGANQSLQPTQNVDSANSNLETPSFLRRSTSGLAGPDPTGLSPIPVRKPQQFVGRGLSQLVQGLRDMEDERLEDEWDVLREIEIEQTGASIDAPDSQVQATDPDARGRAFKKKGQKRTTRLVRMRPVVPAKPTTTRSQSQYQSLSEPRPQRTAISAVGSSDVDELGIDDNDLTAVAETQADGPPTAHDAIPAPFEDDDLDSLHSVSEAEADSVSDPDYDADLKPLGKSKSFSEKLKEAIGASGAVSDTKQAQEREKAKAKENEKEKENIDTKAKKPSTRTINPQAHANYRSLKIRNRGGRAGGRNFGRFRRR
ncbi:DNA replication/checkpoint protein [Aspergillus desertorum]